MVCIYIRYKNLFVLHEENVLILVNTQHIISTDNYNAHTRTQHTTKTFLYLHLTIDDTLNNLLTRNGSQRHVTSLVVSTSCRPIEKPAVYVIIDIVFIYNLLLVDKPSEKKKKNVMTCSMLACTTPHRKQ